MKEKPKSVSEMSRDELEVSVAAQNQWIDDALMVFGRVREMVIKANEVMLARGDRPSKFSDALLQAIGSLEKQVRG